MWDRDSAALIHCIQAPDVLQGQLTSFAWNSGSSDYMFATGTHDGAVHIWSIPKLDLEDKFDLDQPFTHFDKMSDTTSADDAQQYFSPRFPALRRLTGAQDDTTLVSLDFEAGA